MIDISMLKGTLDMIHNLFIKEKDNPTKTRFKHWISLIKNT